MEMERRETSCGVPTGVALVERDRAIGPGWGSEREGDKGYTRVCSLLRQCNRSFIHSIQFLSCHKMRKSCLVQRGKTTTKYKGDREALRGGQTDR